MQLQKAIPVLLLLLQIALVNCELSCDSDKVSCTEDNLVKIYHEVNGLKQDDPALIEFVKNHVLIPPDDKPLNLISTSRKRLNGQFGQVQVAQDILGLKSPKKKQQQGFFIEAGAACGEEISNSLFFELVYGWTGLLVEPNPDLLGKLLQKHRKAWILPHCLSTKPEVEIVSFDASMYNSGIYLEGKPKPSNLGADPDRPPKPYRRMIRVIALQIFSQMCFNSLILQRCNVSLCTQCSKHWAILWLTTLHWTLKVPNTLC